MSRSNLALLACAALGSIAVLVLALFLLDVRSTPVGSEDTGLPPAAATNRDDAVRPGGGLPTPPDESKLRRRVRRRPIEAAERSASGDNVPSGHLAGRLLVGAGDASDSFPVTLGRGATGTSPVPFRRASRTEGWLDVEAVLGVESLVQRFEFPDVPPGAYELVVCRGTQPVVRAPVEVHGRTEVELELPAPKGEQSLVVHVVDDKGRPLEGMRFLLQYETGMRSVGGKMQPDGSYRVGPSSVIAEALTSGQNSCSLQAGRDDAGARRVAVGRGQRELEVVFDLSSRAQLIVDVAGFAAVTHGDRAVVVIEQPAADRPASWFRDKRAIDGTGRAIFELPSSGEWQVKLWMRARRKEIPGRNPLRDSSEFEPDVDPMMVARASVTLQPGSNRLRLAMPPLFNLTIRTDLREAGEIRVIRMDGRESQRVTRRVAEGDHSTDFDLLPAGNYQVRTSENGTVVVVLPEQTEVRFERR